MVITVNALQFDLLVKIGGNLSYIYGMKHSAKKTCAISTI